MPIVNGKYVLDAKIQKKWFNPGSKIKEHKLRHSGTCPSEYDEQCALVQWLELAGYKFSAIPNSTWTTYSQQNKNKSSGVRAGLPDLLVIVNDRLCWIEMKRSDRKPKKGGCGGVSAEQQAWIEALNKCQNCQVFVCYSFEEARDAVVALASLPKV